MFIYCFSFGWHRQICFWVHWGFSCSKGGFHFIFQSAIPIFHSIIFPNWLQLLLFQLFISPQFHRRIRTQQKSNIKSKIYLVWFIISDFANFEQVWIINFNSLIVLFNLNLQVFQCVFDKGHGICNVFVQDNIILYNDWECWNVSFQVKFSSNVLNNFVLCIFIVSSVANTSGCGCCHVLLFLHFLLFSSLF